jgi:hypothetical protein
MTPQAHICNWYHAATAIDPESGRVLPGVALDGLESHGMCTDCRVRFFIEELEPLRARHESGAEFCRKK